MEGRNRGSLGTLLIVGNRANGFEQLTQSLGSAGCRVLRAETGEDALNVLGLNSVDLALVACDLGDADGASVCREIRATPGIADVPLFLFGKDGEQAELDAFEAGAEGLLREDSSDALLAAKVTRVLSLNRYARLHEQSEKIDQNERQLTVLKQYDHATGLPNEKMFRQALTQEIERAERSDYPLAVLVVDVAEYDDLVGVYGREQAEQLARHVADRLTHAARGRALISRMDNSSFGICQPLPRAEQLTEAVHNYRRALSGSMQIGKESISLSTNVGASLFPSDGQDADRLVNLATTAMSHARQTGRNRYHVFAPAARAEAKRRLRLEARIREAIDNEDLELFYQPRVSLETGEVTAVEALLRMRKDETRFISPDEFIPVAQDAGMMDALGRWALHRACRDASKLIADEHHLRMAVNITGKLFATDDFAADVHAALDAAGLNGSNLELEITESALRPQLHQGLSMLRRKLKSLRDENISIAVDDFGTGYSCLGTLHQLPLDVIKIDREFIAEVPSDRKAASVVQTIASLSFNLGLRTVAEGVETDKQVRFLNDAGCEEAQGYLSARPVAFDELGETLNQLEENWTVSE